MIQKQAVEISFSKGVNQKVDPKQLALDQFEELVNSVFTKDGLMQKRNGYGSLPSLPDTSSSYVTTLNGNLTAIGPAIQAYNESNKDWVSRGNIQPLELSTLPLIRNSINQTQADSVVATNGLVCTAYTETTGSAVSYKYAIADSVTGQNIVAPTLLPGVLVSGSPRVFILGPYFIIAYTNTITATSHLQYIAISYNNPTAGPLAAPADISPAYTASTGLSWDGVVVGNNIYFAYYSSSGPAVKARYMDSAFNLSSEITFAGTSATLMSLTVDNTNISSPIIYISFYNGTSVFSAAVDIFLNIITGATSLLTASVANIATAAQNGAVTIYAEINNNYSYDSGVPSHYILSTVMNQDGSAGATKVVIRSMGLASKAFIINGTQYVLSVYKSDYQPTYFLINGTLSTSAAPVITAKLAYENGNAYLTHGLPSVSISGTTASVAYLFKDLISAVNKNTDVPNGTQTAGIYSQTGINLANFDITSQGSIDTSEIAGNLHISGGFLWMYDGYLPVEHNFFLYPDSIEATGSGSGGTLPADSYYIQATYEWSDNQGNLYRSAPSIPVGPVVTTGSTSQITVNIPTLRLTYKTANPVKICVYMWSLTNQIYYQVNETYINSPLLNDTTSDSVSVVVKDPNIIGNNILYTTGGVVEDINAPATSIMTLFDTRLWLVDAEDKNLLWFSKQVIEATPVEMSDLLTRYVTPNTGTTGTTGPITALAPMGDKLIIFKKNAIYYINGTGPDNTGANSQYSEATFITSTVGCDNQQSIVLTPDGLMFQSDKGIWLLGNGMGTSYIGAPVENFNSPVTSSLAIPETNQVRLAISSGEILVYDYYYQRWGWFEGAPSISSCIYQDQHTLINSFGEVSQETPGLYVDGSNPVLMAFVTSWLKVAGLQGYMRTFFFYLLGQYLSPHKLYLRISYDYNPSPIQSSLIIPDNFSGSVPSPYGAPVPFGGPGNVEQWRVFLKKKRCQAFQIRLNEIYDPSQGFPPGAGLTMSGLNLVVGVKKGWRNIGAVHTVGSNG